MKAALVLAVAVSAALLLSAAAAAQTIELTLEEAIRLGLENSSDVKMAEYEALAAQTDVKAAKAGRYPDVGGSASYQHLFEQPQTAGFFLSAKDSVSFSLDAQQPIYTFGRISAGIDLADVGYERALINLESEKQTLVLNIKRAFQGYLLAREALDVQEETLQNKQDALEIARQRFEAGLGTRLDVLRAESDVAGFMPDLISARNQVDLAELTVLDLLDLEVQTEEYRDSGVDVVLVGDLEPRYHQFEIDRLLELAMAENYNLQEFRTGIEAAREELQLNKAQRLPSIAGFGNYSIDSGVNPMTGETDFSDWSDLLTVGVSVQVPISELFPWSAENAAVDKSEYNIQSLNEGLQSITGSIRLGIRDALLRLEEQRSVITSSEKQVELAREVLATSEESYRNGLITSLELQDAQLNLQAAQLGYLRAVFNYNTVLYDLYDLVGVTEME
jgi:outer membrane protein TolC